jgi:hypothetical protein
VRFSSPPCAAWRWYTVPSIRRAENQWLGKGDALLLPCTPRWETPKPEEGFGKPPPRKGWFWNVCKVVVAPLAARSLSYSDERVANRNGRDFGWEIAHAAFRDARRFPSPRL